MTTGIYCIENTISNKKYIGQSSNIGKRMYEKHGNSTYLMHAFKKYGENSFIRYVIEYCDYNELSLKEMYYIKAWGTKSPDGYNLTNGGEGNLGWKPSEETKRKISNTKMGSRTSPETKIKMSIAATGRIVPEETRKKISESRKGFTASIETREKISNSLIGSCRHTCNHTEETKKRISESKSNPPLSTRIKNSEGTRGKKRKKNATSEYVGVSFDKKNNRWKSTFEYMGKKYWIGRFTTEESAAIAYNLKAVEICGPDARINIVKVK